MRLTYPETKWFYQRRWGMKSLVIVLLGFLVVSCDSSQRDSNKEQRRNTYDFDKEPYPRPYTYTPRESAPHETTTSESTPSKGEQQTKPQHPAPVKSSVTISEYYQEGYEKGYDDGEDDAVMGNGFDGQYDDDNPYKGQHRKDYEEGYKEGYEAGYFDNKDYE